MKIILYTSNPNSEDGLSSFHVPQDFDVHDEESRLDLIEYAMSEFGSERAFFLIHTGN